MFINATTRRQISFNSIRPYWYLLACTPTFNQNTIGLGLPMFINATTRQQISFNSIHPYWYLLACTHTFGKVGVQKKFFACSARESCFVPPHFKIRGAAPGFAASEVMTYIGLEILLFIDQFVASLAYKLISYWLVNLAAFGCLSTLSLEQLMTAAKTVVDSYPNDLDNSFVDELCHFAKFADIFEDDEPGNISTELYCTNWLLLMVCRTLFPMLQSH